MLTLYNNVFKQVWDWLNGVVNGIGLDNYIDQAVAEFKNIDEIFKWLIVLLVALLLVLGTFSLIRKLFKLFVFIAIVFIIYIVVKTT